MLEKVKGTVEKAKSRIDYYDYNLVAVILLLTCFGLVMLYSTSAYTAELKFEDGMYYFRKQALISLVGFALMLLASRIDYRVLSPLSPLVYLAAVICMGLVKTPLGVEVNGAKRWLNLGVTFQPSEIAKLALIMFLPYLIVKMGKKIASARAVIVLFLVGGLLSGMAYVFTENLSTAVILLGMTFLLVYVAHPKSLPFYILFGVAAAAIGIGLWYLSHIAVNSSSFRIERILAWLNPEEYVSGKGYQVLQALYAIGSGGLFGKGLGNSTQKLGWVPEAQNDMIFSIICEELGIFGALIVLLLFGYLLYRLLFIAQNAPDLLGSLMVSGIFIHIALQVILNICVVINLIPTTGITMPFISYGGTSILFLMAEMALALSVSRQIKFQADEEAAHAETDSFFGVVY